MSKAKIFIGFLIVFVTGYVTTCSYKEHIKSRAFDAIQIGESVDTALKRFGNPDFREKQGQLYPRYAITPCTNPCVERIWFENNFVPIEAWSIEIDREGKIIHKAHWVST